MPPKPWKTLSSRIAYRNPWTTLREDIAEMPNGKTTIYGVVECVDAVGVLPFLDDDRVVMIRQYRYAFGEGHRWEMPTGAVKPGESLEAAADAVAEEIGYDAAELTHVAADYSSKSIMREVCHLYLGRGLSPAQAAPDETEFLEVAVMPFRRVYELTLASEVPR